MLFPEDVSLGLASEALGFLKVETCGETVGSPDGKLGERWVLEAVGGNWWVTGLGAGFVGESGGT